MTTSARLSLILLAAALALAVGAGPAAAERHDSGQPVGHAGPDHVFVIMLENHSQHSVIDQRDASGHLVAPYITSLAHTYATADRYHGVTHPSEPNYIAAITGSNWGLQDDNVHILDVPSIVDQLEAHGLAWNAYMEAMPPDDKLAVTAPGSTALYAIKHNPFVLMQNIRSNPARLAHVKPLESLAGDLADGQVGNFVWITPDQCNDMHGGVFVSVPGRPETPCPYGDAVHNDAADVALQNKADSFVQRTIATITHSSAWTRNSAIFVTADENDFDSSHPELGSWESADGCCDSPFVPAGDPRISPNWPGGIYGGGLVPAILVTPHTPPRPPVSHRPYNHYSFLATVEKLWKLGYLQNAGDRAHVPTMDSMFAHSRAKFSAGSR
jgi:hypothetical protein